MSIKPDPVYETKILNDSITLKSSQLNTDNFDLLILNELKKKLNKKCTSNGLVNPDSIEILSRSLGKYFNNDIKSHTNYLITFKADICCPREGQIVECFVDEHTDAITICYIDNIDNSPLEIHLSKQNMINNVEYNNLNKNDIIYVRVIGYMIEANTDKIRTIAEFLKKK